MTPTARPPWWTRLAHELYVAALSAALVVFALVPLHRAATAHANLERAGPGFAEFRYADHALEVGAVVPLYRFNPGWIQAIGRSRVADVGPDGRVSLAWDPASFMWPVGRQGTIVEVGPSSVTLNVGADAELQVGETFHLYDERRHVGQVRIERVEPTRSVATVTNKPSVALLGLTASPYTIPTQASWLAWWWVAPFEGAAFALLAVWLVARRYGGLSERALAVCRAPFAAIARWPTPWHLLGGVPAAYCGGVALATTLAVLWDMVALRTGARAFPLDDARWGAIAFVGLQYYATWWRTGRSPMLVFWEALSYRPVTHAWTAALGIPGLNRYTVNWALHLIIVYAFSNTILDLLRGNLQIASEVGWRSLGLGFGSWTETAASVLAMATHAPDVASPEVFWTVSRLLVYSTCIIGCLVGYAHSVVAILYKRTVIRDVDFTLAGWWTAAVCYGGLLGRVQDSFMAGWAPQDPAVADGPLFVAIQAVELFLNVSYTASIFNLFTLFGLLVNKGLRTSGYYGVVRHPSYTLESLMFAMVYCAAWSTPQALVTGLVPVVFYWLRSEREEHFMYAANGDFAAYRRQVPWKFVPGLY